MDGLAITAVKMSLDARCRVMETAIEAGPVHGIGYWAEVKQTKRLELDGEDRIGAMRIKDIEDENGRTFWINGENIEKAVQQMLADPQTRGCGGVISQMLTDGLDGPLADCIVQVACFGEVVYG